MKRIIQISLDISMLILLIILMCEHTLSGLAHESIGIVLFALFLILNILNYRWYKVLFLGRVSKKMIPSIVINFLILITLLVCMESSLLISGYIFKGLIKNGMMLGRSLHMVSSVWLFLFVCIHFGFHLNLFLFKFKDFWIFKTFEILIILCGLFIMIFIDRMYEEMFFLIAFKSYDETPFIIDFLKKIAIALSVSLIGFNITNFIRRKR